METTIYFGYWLRRQRKALDLTQQVLAERGGCSLAAIKKIESDERRPSRQITERTERIEQVPPSLLSMLSFMFKLFIESKFANNVHNLG